jgi:hypothetical protein
VRRIAGQQLHPAGVLAPGGPKHEPLALSLADLAHPGERLSSGANGAVLGQQVRMSAKCPRLRRGIVAHAPEDRLGLGQCLGNGSRAPSEVHGEHARKPARVRIREPIGDRNQSVNCLARRSGAAQEHAREVQEPACTDERFLLVVRREEVDCRARRRTEPIDGLPRRRETQLELSAADVGAGAGYLVDAVPGVQFVEDTEGLGAAATVD